MADPDVLQSTLHPPLASAGAGLEPKWFAIPYFVPNAHLLLSSGFYGRVPYLKFLLCACWYLERYYFGFAIGVLKNAGRNDKSTGRRNVRPCLTNFPTLSRK